MTKKQEQGYQVAQDAGGSMTDCFLVDRDGKFTTGKFLSNHVNEEVSYLGSLQDAARRWGLTSADIHKGALSSTYTGTAMVNILVTREGSKVGLLITRGFGDMPIQERGLTWLGQSYEDILHQQLHEHTPWMVQPENIVEITERITVGQLLRCASAPARHHRHTAGGGGGGQGGQRSSGQGRGGDRHSDPGLLRQPGP